MNKFQIKKELNRIDQIGILASLMQRHASMGRKQAVKPLTGHEHDLAQSIVQRLDYRDRFNLLSTD